MASSIVKLGENKEHIQRAVRLAWPAIVESFFVALVAFVDSFMVSQLGTYAVAAVGLTTQPKFLCLTLFMSVNVAVSALVARRKGQNDRDSANRILITALLCAVVALIVVSAAAITFADPLMHLVGSEPDTHDSAVLYFRIIMGGSVFQIISLIINAAQRGSGNTKIAMTTNVTSNLVNVVFNYLLIGGNFGFPRLGVAGAAIATVIGTAVACAMSIASLFRKISFVSIPYMIQNKLRATRKAFRDIIAFASNIVVEQLMARVGFFTTAVLAANLGTNAMAAHQVGLNVMHLTFAFGEGLQVASVALIGESLGRKEKELAKKYGRICQGIGLGISVILSAILIFAGGIVYRLYFPGEPEIIEIGVLLMRIMSIIVLCQISQYIFMGSLRGAGDVRFTAMACTISVAFIRPLISYLAAYPLGWGIVGIWMGVFADQLARLVFTALRFRTGKWMHKEI